MEQLAGLRGSLDRLRGDPEVARQWRALLRPVREYDAARAADLTRTLETFLQEGGNIAATADRLFLHRNSVIYRLGRIKELLGLDPRQREVRETLTLALAIASDHATQASAEERAP